MTQLQQALHTYIKIDCVRGYPSLASSLALPVCYAWWQLAMERRKSGLMTSKELVVLTTYDFGHVPLFIAEDDYSPVSYVSCLGHIGPIHTAGCDPLRRMPTNTHGPANNRYGIRPEMVIRAVQQNLKILEIPITYHPREGQSKLNASRDALHHLQFMFKYKLTSAKKHAAPPPSTENTKEADRSVS